MTDVGGVTDVVSSHRIFDADSHVIEPRDLFTSRVSAKWGDQVPHVRYNQEAQEEDWYIGDEVFAPAWGNAAQGWEKHWPPYPPTEAEVVPAAIHAAARVALLDEQKIATQVLYPNIAGFGGQKFLLLEDPELMLSCVQAYNDFLTDWTSVAPERFVAIAALPFWDVDASVAELQRAAAQGHRGILFSGAPQNIGFPYLGDPHWNPIWAAAQEAGLPVHIHLGSGDIRKSMKRPNWDSRSSMVSRVPTELFLGIGSQLNDLLLSGVLARFPDLQFVMAESGVGAIPFILKSADYHFERSDLRAEWPWYDMRPSEYFRRQVFVTFWFEQLPQGADLYDVIGIDNVMFETDFPHPTSLGATDVAPLVERVYADLSPEDAGKVVYGNAQRLYSATS